MNTNIGRGRLFGFAAILIAATALTVNLTAQQPNPGANQFAPKPVNSLTNSGPAPINSPEPGTIAAVVGAIAAAGGFAVFKKRRQN